jgi:hypothetical protein
MYPCSFLPWRVVPWPYVRTGARGPGYTKPTMLILTSGVLTSVQVLEGRADVPIDSAAAAAELIARGDACKRKAPTDLHFLYL